MNTGSLAVLAGIIIPLGLFAMIFAIVYLYKKERMAMIERGMELNYKTRRPAPYSYLKWGLLLAGAGLGLLLASILNVTALANLSESAVTGFFFSLIVLFGGLGLVLSYSIEKKEILDKENDKM